MNNKFLTACFILSYLLLLFCFFIITLDLLKLVAITKIVVDISTFITIVIAGFFLTVSSVLKQRLEDSNNSLEIDKEKRKK
ncbi:MAG: hypothetical protein WC516_04415 [Patescibacteria group bacterium]